MKELMDTARTIYGQLQDEVSKFMFENRILYMLTGDYRYISRIILFLPQRQELDKAVEKCRQHIDEVVIWGTGNDLLILTELYPDLGFQYLCDKNKEKQEKGWRGIPVMSPEELVKKKDKVYVAINTSGFHEEILEYLLENGFSSDRIINLGVITDSLYKSQYFDKDILNPLQEEGVFIDGGCYDCHTDQEFIKWCRGRYEKIYAFEPDEENYEKCLEKCRKEQIKNIEIYRKGLWDSETELSFQANMGQGSRIGEGACAENIVKVSTAAIDSIAAQDRVTFIKLDVEGAELKALQGAEKTIRRDRPRLAICIYHKPEDIVEIPAYILSLHSDYKLYIRHYQMSPNETILYAI